MVLPIIIKLLSTFISLTEGNVNIEVLEGNAEEIIKNLFATTLLDTTIQDGGTRARSGIIINTYLDDYQSALNYLKYI